METLKNSTGQIDDVFSASGGGVNKEGIGDASTQDILLLEVAPFIAMKAAQWCFEAKKARLPSCKNTWMVDQLKCCNFEQKMKVFVQKC